MAFMCHTRQNAIATRFVTDIIASIHNHAISFCGKLFTARGGLLPQSSKSGN